MMKGCLIVFLLLPLIFGFSAQGMAELATVRVAQIPIASSLPFYVAQEKKFFEEEGLKVEVQNMAGGAVILPALSGGSVDIGFTNYLTVIIAAEKGFDYMIIAPQNRNSIVRIEGRDEDSSAVLALEASGIRGPRDLKGKVVAVNTLRNINDLYMYEWLERNGLDPRSDVKWVEIPFPKMGPVLRSRQADAAFMVEPFVTAELEAGGVKAIGFPYLEVHGSVEMAGYVATKSWIDKNPDLVQRFVRALYKGMDYTKKHPEEWGSILTKYTRIKPELISKMRMSIDHWQRPLDLVGLQTQADLARKWGLIKEPVGVGRIVHTTAR